MEQVLSQKMTSIQEKSENESHFCQVQPMRSQMQGTHFGKCSTSKTKSSNQTLKEEIQTLVLAANDLESQEEPHEMQVSESSFNQANQASAENQTFFH